MPLLLRAIRKSKWSTSNNISWLSAQEIQADALGDLKTSNNTLSVWYVEDDKSNLEQVIIALAANRDTISNLDYALFDLNLVEDIGIKIEVNEGATPYESANRWHRDLVELSVTKLVKLAKVILTKSHKERIPEKKILSLIRDTVKNGNIDKTKLPPKIAGKLD
ncbi:MAG: hypothetical protein ACRC2R_06660 [Xenococcaceae cyanobacterium]